MTYLSVPILVVTAFALASCTPAPVTSTLPAPTTPPNSAAIYASGVDPDFAAKCDQRVRAATANIYTAQIALSGDASGDVLQATVTTTDPDNGETTTVAFVCKRDENRAVTAKLISD